MINLTAILADVNSRNMVFEDRHTLQDERDLLDRELAEEEWERNLEHVGDLLAEAAEFLAEEADWQDMLSGVAGLLPEERRQALGLRLAYA